MFNRKMRVRRFAGVTLRGRGLRGVLAAALSAALLAALFGAPGASADNDRFKVDVSDFSRLSIGTGVVAEVVCGDSNRVVIEADERVFERMKVNVRGGRLVVERGYSLSSVFFRHNDNIRATITTTGRLNDIEASTGAILEAPACAVDESRLDVEVHTGANLRVEGHTGDLQVDVGTGGVFNPGRYKDRLTASVANVHVSTGGVVGVCGADRVAGKASTGAQIYAADSAEVDVRLGTGAGVSSSGC